MTVLPSLFISHGAPNLIIHDSPTRTFLSQLGQSLPRPKAVLIMSAHFDTEAPAFEIGDKPGMIYDFGGFEPELYKMTYNAPGAPGLAREAAELALKAGLNPVLSQGRGYDHGAWVPLKLIYPEADIPVATLSVQSHLSGAHHLALGRALAPLREQGVLVIGSGGATHNLRAFFGGASTPAWAETFNEWLREKAETGDEAAIADWTKAPDARQNHPTPEHFLPFPFAFGAAGPGAKGKRLTHDYVGPISLDAYAFG
jgi:4,5-DOPA dioxygenase extradiol